MVGISGKSILIASLFSGAGKQDHHLRVRGQRMGGPGHLSGEKA